jgi:hypothetical protein
VKEPHRREEHNQCIHTKNIYLLLDLGQQDVIYNFLKNHEKKCDKCTIQLKKYKEENLASKVFVPKPFIPRDMRETFNGEVSELFKLAGLNEVANKKKKLKKSLLALDHGGEIFLKNLSSKTMLKAYALALIAFVAMKFFI